MSPRPCDLCAVQGVLCVWVGVVGDVHDVTTRRKWGKNG